MYELGTLILTHSSRSIDRKRCCLNFLTRRYSDPSRLDNLPLFEDLPSEKSYGRDYHGSVSFFKFHRNAQELVDISFVGNIRSRRGKIQHTVLVGERKLLVCYESCLEVWKFRDPVHLSERITSSDYSVERQFKCKYFSGLHTVYPLSKNRAVLSSSAADAILILNLKTGIVENIYRMPSYLYGNNYDLTPDMDMKEHYIGNDYQTTHINSAYPFNQGQQVAVSTLVQGAIGIFDLISGNYTEITHGFIGCHGARVNDVGQIYFADSVTGTLVILDDHGKINMRYAVASRWLHDVQQIANSIYAFAVADSNELRIEDIQRGKLLFRYNFFTCPVSKFFDISNILARWKGNSTQFLSYYAIS